MTNTTLIQLKGEANMEIRQLFESDLSEVVKVWNRQLPYDHTTEKHFQRQILDDPNYEPDGVLLAIDDGSVHGLSACFIRHTIQGRDGRGMSNEFEQGFLKGFFVVPSPKASLIAKRLLVASEEFCKEAGKTYLRVGEYTYDALWAGVDIRYNDLYGIFTKNGYRDINTIEDVEVTLDKPALTAILEKVRQQVEPHISVATWQPDLLAPMKHFVMEGKMPVWFPKGWEKTLVESREDVLILRQGEKIIGWAEYRVSIPRASFGPILVLENERGKGYGKLLLLESMMRAKEQGSSMMWAGWANTGFYVSVGWHIYRRYAIFNKDL